MSKVIKVELTQQVTTTKYVRVEDGVELSDLEDAIGRGDLVADSNGEIVSAGGWVYGTVLNTSHDFNYDSVDYVFADATDREIQHIPDTDAWVDRLEQELADGGEFVTAIKDLIERVK